MNGAQLQDVAWTGTRFVAFGIALTDGRYAFLDSADGTTWDRQAALATGVNLRRLAVGRRGIVAIGTIGDRPSSWTSVDGRTWTAAPDAFLLPVPLAGEDRVSVTDVVATSDGWLAVGRADPFCEYSCGIAPVRSYVWTSGDGLRWSAVAEQGSLLAGGMEAVAAGGPGFVAAGTEAGHVAIWTSPTGVVWSRVPDAPIFHASATEEAGSQTWAISSGVAARPGAIVVVGMAFGVGPGGAPTVAAWVSSDGTTWTQATGDRFVEGQVFSVAATGDGFLATGPSGDTSCLGGIWASADGRAWTCSATDPSFSGFGPYAAAASSTMEVAVGLTNAGSDANPDNAPGGAVFWRQAQS